ncbi:MAG: glycosyltransferase [Muribaculaceae bacterium]|nr:glycosyltransferase [Muribaculaceae bacterium]
MKISIIIPVYNAEKYLSDCIESVLLQDYTGELEIIAVNDGSIDKSEQILNRLSHIYPRLKVISKKNGGPSSARNAGIEQASGDWLLFVDADDLLLPGALKSFAEVIKNNDQDIIIGLITKKERKNHRFTKKSELVKEIGPLEAVLSSLYQNNTKITVGAPGKLFRKSLFEKVRFENSLYYEDLDLIPRLFYNSSKIAILEKEVYYYRNNSQSFLNRWSEKRFDVLKATERLKEWSRNIGEPKIERAVNERALSAAFNVLLLMKKHGITNKEMIVECKRIIKKQRLKSLTDHKVRLKNKSGIVISYAGFPMLYFIDAVISQFSKSSSSKSKIKS